LLLLLLASSAFAQSGTITTYAGPPLPANGVSAITAALDWVTAVVPDGAGNLYFSSTTQDRIYRIAANGTLSVIAGEGTGFGGDGGPATSAQLSYPTGIALDAAAGNVFIADTYNHRVRRVTPAGIITTVAGNGTIGFSGDGGPATSASLQKPQGVAVDAAGNLFIADSDNHRIRKVTPAGIITTIAGNGTGSFGGDGGPATSAQLSRPSGIALDPAGNLFIADSANSRVRKLTPAGIITTVAGIGRGGDGGPATSAQVDPIAVGLDAAGNLFIADSAYNRIRKVTPTGIISTVAGNGTRGFSGDGGPANAAQLTYPSGIALDAMGNVFIADRDNERVRKVTPAGIITTIAGRGRSDGFSGDGGPAASAQLNNPSRIAVDAAGTLFIADSGNSRIRKVNAAGTITTVAGNGTSGFSGDGGPATSARINYPSGIALDAAGSLFIADYYDNRIRKVTPTGIITTVAGNGTSGFSGDGGPATSAQLSYPSGIALDAARNLFIGDSGNHRVRKVTPAGITTTVAGNGTDGFSGDGGPATSAQLSFPDGIAVDTGGNLLIADSGNNRIRKVTPAGIISTVVGDGTSGFRGDGGPATSAQLDNPEDLALDAAGNLFIADTYNTRIRKVTPTGMITTVAGNGQGFSGDGGPATSAGLVPLGVAVDAAGTLFIAASNSRIRKITFTQQSQPSISFSFVDRGGVSLLSSGASASTAVGYASIQPNSGSTTPSGLAIFGFRQNNVLVTEAGVPASPLLQSGRIYAEVNGPVNTGLAIANPNNQVATVSFFFTGSNGNFGSGSTTIPANGQVAAFLNESPFNSGSSVGGTFTFNSSVPISVIALRGLTNERREFLVTTLPVADLSAVASTSPVVFPHFADGGGWTTQVVLVNPGDTVLTGTV